jgi:hypothetical protein
MLTLLLILALVAVIFGLGAALEVAFWAFALVVLVVVGVLLGTGLYLRRQI